jgi:hypothetical protein
MLLFQSSVLEVEHCNRQLAAIIHLPRLMHVALARAIHLHYRYIFASFLPT